jgi:hypothetical protein
MNKDEGQRFLELIEKRDKLFGTKIDQMLHNLSISNYTVNRNYQHLLAAITSYEGNLQIWAVKNRAKFHAFIKELMRLFHNYLSSTYSLVEHNRKFCKDLKCVELSKTYSERVAALLSNNCVTFIKDLRRFSQHVGIPLLSGQISLKPEKKEFKQRILLQKEEFVKMKGWKEASEEYINLHQEIDLKLVLIEYQSLIKNFYQWFYKKATDVYSRELEELAEINSEIERLRPF